MYYFMSQENVRKEIRNLLSLMVSGCGGEIEELIIANVNKLDIFQPETVVTLH